MDGLKMFVDGVEKLTIFIHDNKGLRWKLKGMHPQHRLFLGCHTVLCFIINSVHYFEIKCIR